MRIDIMTDIETLGVSSGTTVFQLSACSFDINTGIIINTFNQIVDINSESLKVDGSTLLWWLNTNGDLLKDLFNKGTVSQKELFVNFRKWIIDIQDEISDNRNVFLWGNGILFDNKIIQSKMKEYDIDYPIFYRNDRDMRTIIELAGLKTGISTEKEFREKHRDNSLVAHDALSDVISQIGVLSKAWNIILEGKNE